MKGQNPAEIIIGLFVVMIILALIPTIQSSFQCPQDLETCGIALSSCQSTNTDLANQIEDLTARITDLTDQLESERLSVAECEKKLLELNQNLRDLIENLTNCQGNLTECESNLTQCIDDLNQCRNKLGSCEMPQCEQLITIPNIFILLIPIFFAFKFGIELKIKIDENRADLPDLIYLLLVIILIGLIIIFQGCL